jgi:LPXTG-motif cell wall-anchored protein
MEMGFPRRDRGYGSVDYWVYSIVGDLGNGLPNLSNNISYRTLPTSKNGSEETMTTILIIAVLFLLLGGGGYYGFRRRG